MCHGWLPPKQSLRKGPGGEVVYLEGDSASRWARVGRVRQGRIAPLKDGD